jgi:hypothetical protein
MKPKTLIILLLVTALGTLGFRTVSQFFQVDSCLDSGGRWNEDCNCCEQGDSNVIGTTWVSLGGYFANDTLNFTTANNVEYFMGELEWIFDSKYEQSKDTLTILTKTFAFEMDDVSKFPPNLRQTFLLTTDSLILLNLENRNNERWESANSEQMQQLNNFFKVK